MNLTKKIKSYTIFYIKILIVLLILIPKKYGAIFNTIPIRLVLLAILPIIFSIEYKRKRIELNDFKFKYLPIIYVAFIVLASISLFVTKNLEVSIYTLLKFIMFGIDFGIICKIKFEKKDIIDFIKCFLISILIASLYSILQYIKYIDLNYNGTEKYFGIRGRVISTFFNPIYYGIFINLVFIFILYIRQQKLIDNKIVNILLMLFPILLYFTLILTFTRSTLLVFWGIIFLILICNYKIIINKITIITLMLCMSLHFIVPGAIYVAQSTTYYGIEMLHIDDVYHLITGEDALKLISNDNKEIFEDDSSVEHRKDFADIGIKIANKKPLTGVGFGSYIDYMFSHDFDTAFPKYDKIKDYPHAGFIMLAAETGYIATSLFIICLILIASILIRFIYKHFKQRDKIYTIACISFSIFIGLFITTIVAENPIYDTQLFPLFLIIIGLSINYIFILLSENKKVKKKNKKKNKVSKK